MKKLILTNVLALLAVVTFGQSSKTFNNDVPKELTINGIPYTQYKAQQDALKQKQAAENKAAVTPAPVANEVNNTHATAQQNVQQAPVITKPASITAPTATKPSRLNGITATQADMAPVPDQKLPTATTPVAKAKPVVEQNIDKTISGTLVARPVVDISTGAGIQPAPVPANTGKMPEQKLTQEVQKIEEVPASVAPTAPKIPATSKKSGK